MNKYLLVAVFLTVGATAQADLQEKLAANSSTIATIEQNVRAGDPIVVNKGCRTKGCSRCNKCNMVVQ